MDVLNTSEWSSLEITKLIVSVVTPITVAYIAYKLSRLAKEIETSHWTNQKIIEKRIQVYDSIVPKLNDLMCFYCYIGNWKELSPGAILSLKRSLDKELNIYAPLFSPDLLLCYNELMGLCFETFTGWGKDALIKSLPDRRKDCFGIKWQPDWDKRFSNNVTDPKDVRAGYSKLLEILKNDLEIYKDGFYLVSEIPTINFKKNNAHR